MDYLVINVSVSLFGVSFELMVVNVVMLLECVFGMIFGLIGIDLVSM